MWTDHRYPSRRAFLAHTAFGVGAFALAHLLREDGLLADAPQEAGREPAARTSKPRPPHFAPKATAMISLFMHGGPSHVDLLDPKPELTKHARHGLRRRRRLQLRQPGQQEAVRQPLEVRQARPVRHRGLRAAARRRRASSTTSAWSARCTPGTTATRSRSATSTAASPAITGRPTMGSWIVYGLGSESQDLPAYMVLSDPGGPPGRRHASTGRAGSCRRSTRGPCSARRSRGSSTSTRRRTCAATLQRQNLAFLDRLNRRHLAQHPGEADLEARIRSYELAAAMQTAAKEALDVSSEPAYIRRLYGLDQDATREYGTRCLIARRLVERGVRFVQLFLGGQPWDTHSTIRTDAARRSAGGPTSRPPRW